MKKNFDELEKEIEGKVKKKEKRKRKRPTVSGKSVFQIQEMLKKRRKK